MPFCRAVVWFLTSTRSFTAKVAPSITSAPVVRATPVIWLAENPVPMFAVVATRTAGLAATSLNTMLLVFSTTLAVSWRKVLPPLAVPLLTKAR